MTPKDRKLYENLQILVYALQLEDDQWPFEHLTKQEAFNEVIKESSLNFGFSPDNPQFLSLIEKKIYEILSKPPEQLVGNIPPKSILEANFEKEFDNLQQEKIKYTYPTLNEQIKKIRQSLSEKIRNQLLAKEPQLKTNQGLFKIATDDLTNKILNNLSPTKIKATLFTLQEYESIIDKVEPEINKIISRLGFFENKITPQEKQNLLNQTFKEVQSLSATPRRLISFEESNRLQKMAKKTLKIPPLPPEIRDSLSKEAETAKLKLNPIFVMLHPKTGFALTRKLFYAPRIASLKLAIEGIKPEYQQLIIQGLLPEDLQITIDTLKEMGLKADSPILKHLENQTTYLKDLEEQAPSIFEDIRKYYHYEDLTGQKKIFYPSLDTELPLHRKSSWEKKESYSYYLKTTLDQFKFISDTSQRVIKFLSKGRYKTPIEFLKRGITRRASKWFLKTAAGKAFKAGLKKVGTKLAIRAGIWATASATAVESVGISLLIAAAIEIGTWLGKKAIRLIREMGRDPAKAILVAIIGGFILFLAPMPFKLIGVVPLIIGSVGLVGFVTAPVVLAGISTTIGAFFVSIATFSLTATVAPFIIILFAVLAGLTIFIVMVVSGAFILPQQIKPSEVEFISPYESKFFRLTKTASPNKFESTPSEVTYKITITPLEGAVLLLPEINEEFTTISKGNPPSISPCDFKDLPDEISSPQTLECTKFFDSNFQDTLIFNRFTLQTSVKNKDEENESGRHRGETSAIVIIGTPPGDCPLIYPTIHGHISQGPNAAYSHGGQEAIDLGVSFGTPVISTHTGKVTTVGCGGGKGNFIEVSGLCNGVSFTTAYYHLAGSRVKAGDSVVPLQHIANSGDSVGCSSGEKGDIHLHYEFLDGLKMRPPNIPNYIPSCNSSAECDIRW